MLKNGSILNPSLLSLLALVRHTNRLVIADRGFPCWPEVDTIDISLIDGIPTVLQVLRALREHADYGQAYMAEEFLQYNDAATRETFSTALHGIPTTHEPHEAAFKKRVPGSIGLIRTGDTTQYANIILVSA